MESSSAAALGQTAAPETGPLIVVERPESARLSFSFDDEFEFVLVLPPVSSAGREFELLRATTFELRFRFWFAALVFGGAWLSLSAGTSSDPSGSGVAPALPKRPMSARPPLGAGSLSNGETGSPAFMQGELAAS